MGAALGVDAAVLDLGGALCVLKVDPITTAAHGAGRLAVLVACNDLAAMGAEPVALLAALLFPAGVSVADVDRVTAEIHATASELDVEVVGGHTEVAPGVSHPLIVMTAVGRPFGERLVTAADARPGHALVLTKAVALEGTSILAHDFAAELAGRVAPEVLDEASGYRADVSVLAESRIAVASGATAMHDPTEGGLLGALWEMAEASDAGFRVEQARIPIRPATRAICAALHVDPLRLIASGALLIACEDAERMVAALRAHGVEAHEIGRITAEGRELVAPDGSVRVVETVDRDELYRLLEAHS